MSSVLAGDGVVGVRPLCIPASDFLATTEDGFYVLVTGEVVARSSGSDVFFSSKEFYFVRRGTYIIGAEGRDSHLLWIPVCAGVTQDFIRRHGPVLSGVERCESCCSGTVTFSTTPLLDDCIGNFQRLMKIDHPPLLALFRLDELLMLLALSPQGPKLMSILRQNSNRNVERLQLFMEANYLKEWRLDEFARQFGSSLTVFKELFHSVYGVSPRVWIGERRILYAHHLLLNTKESIVDISMESGFSSQSYFSQSYRRRFGCTPTRARQFSLS